MDVTSLLKTIRVPTLVAHRKGDPTHPFELAREMASPIPDARFAPLEAHVYWPWWGDTGSVLRALNSPARLQGLARPSGICISDIVHTQVHRKLGLSFDDLGQQEVKNIPDSVRVYSIAVPPRVAETT